MDQVDHSALIEAPECLALAHQKRWQVCCSNCAGQHGATTGEVALRQMNSAKIAASGLMAGPDAFWQEIA